MDILIYLEVFEKFCLYFIFLSGGRRTIFCLLRPGFNFLEFHKICAEILRLKIKNMRGDNHFITIRFSLYFSSFLQREGKNSLFLHFPFGVIVLLGHFPKNPFNHLIKLKRNLASLKFRLVYTARHQLLQENEKTKLMNLVNICNRS